MGTFNKFLVFITFVFLTVPLFGQFPGAPTAPGSNNKAVVTIIDSTYVNDSTYIVQGPFASKTSGFTTTNIEAGYVLWTYNCQKWTVDSVVSTVSSALQLRIIGKATNAPPQFGQAALFQYVGSVYSSRIEGLPYHMAECIGDDVSSSIAYRTVIEYDNLLELAAANNIQPGQKMAIKSTGALYQASEDTVAGYATDELAVVTLPNSLYAILDADVSPIEAYGAIANDGQDDLVALQKMAEYAGIIRLTDGDYNVASNATLAAPIDFNRNGRLRVNYNVTLNIKSDLPKVRRQIFSGDGTVLLTSSIIEEAYPEWWGAKVGIDTVQEIHTQDTLFEVWQIVKVLGGEIYLKDIAEPGIGDYSDRFYVGREFIVSGTLNGSTDVAFNGTYEVQSVTWDGTNVRVTPTVALPNYSRQNSADRPRVHYVAKGDGVSTQFFLVQPKGGTFPIKDSTKVSVTIAASQRNIILWDEGDLRDRTAGPSPYGWWHFDSLGNSDIMADTASYWNQIGGFIDLQLTQPPDAGTPIVADYTRVYYKNLHGPAQDTINTLAWRKAVDSGAKTVKMSKGAYALTDGGFVTISPDAITRYFAIYLRDSLSIVGTGKYTSGFVLTDTYSGGGLIGRTGTGADSTGGNIRENTPYLNNVVLRDFFAIGNMTQVTQEPDKQAVQEHQQSTVGIYIAKMNRVDMSNLYLQQFTRDNFIIGASEEESTNVTISNLFTQYSGRNETTISSVSGFQMTNSTLRWDGRLNFKDERYGSVKNRAAILDFEANADGDILDGVSVSNCEIYGGTEGIIKFDPRRGAVSYRGAVFDNNNLSYGTKGFYSTQIGSQNIIVSNNVFRFLENAIESEAEGIILSNNTFNNVGNNFFATGNDPINQVISGTVQTDFDGKFRGDANSLRAYGTQVGDDDYALHKKTASGNNYGPNLANTQLGRGFKLKEDIISYVPDGSFSQGLNAWNINEPSGCEITLDSTWRKSGKYSVKITGDGATICGIRNTYVDIQTGNQQLALQFTAKLLDGVWPTNSNMWSYQVQDSSGATLRTEAFTGGTIISNEDDTERTYVVTSTGQAGTHRVNLRFGYYTDGKAGTMLIDNIIMTNNDITSPPFFSGYTANGQARADVDGLAIDSLIVGGATLGVVMSSSSPYLLYYNDPVDTYDYLQLHGVKDAFPTLEAAVGRVSSITGDTIWLSKSVTTLTNKSIPAGASIGHVGARARSTIDQTSDIQTVASNTTSIKDLNDEVADAVVVEQAHSFPDNTITPIYQDSMGLWRKSTLSSDLEFPIVYVIDSIDQNRFLYKMEGGIPLTTTDDPGLYYVNFGGTFSKTADSIYVNRGYRVRVDGTMELLSDYAVKLQGNSRGDFYAVPDSIVDLASFWFTPYADTLVYETEPRVLSTDESYLRFANQTSYWFGDQDTTEAPEVRLDTAKNLRYFYFDGADIIRIDFDVFGPSTGNQNDDQMMFVMVFDPDEDDTGNAALLCRDVGNRAFDASNMSALGLGYNADQDSLYAMDYQNTSGYVLKAGTDKNLQVVMIEVNSTDDILRIYLNGVEVATSNNTLAGYNGNSTVVPAVGASGQGWATGPNMQKPFKGKIYEAFVFKQLLSTEARAVMNNILTAKYGL